MSVRLSVCHTPISQVAHRESQWISPNFNTPCKIYTHKIFKIKLCPRNYLEDIYQILLQYIYGELSPKYVKYYASVTFLLSCPVLSCPALSCPGYAFFLQLRPGQTHGRILTIHGLNDASSSKNVPFGLWMTTHYIEGLKTPKTSPQKGAWLGIFQPNWQNYKIVISPAWNIGSMPNFDRVIKPHSWLRGWSRITKFIFKMADGRHIAKCWKRYNSPISGPLWLKLG